MKFTNFKINKLWGINSYNIDIEDNKLILVAENGAGKTIILKFMYLFLSKQWSKLKEYDFESISAIIDGRNYEVSKVQLDVKVTQKDIDKLIIGINPSYTDFYKNDFIKKIEENNYNFNTLLTDIKIKIIAENNNTNELLLYKIVIKTRKLLYENFEQVVNLPVIPVMYLPTYRRIEKNIHEISDIIRADEDETFNEIAKIWNGFEKKRWEQDEINYLEIIEFGINDIKFKFDNNSYSNEKIDKFINISNNYLVNKKIIYLENKLKVAINDAFFDINTKNILSSGEKQIVSLFFYLIIYEKKYLIIFDEPEISISSVKHENILPDIDSTDNHGFISATHSPFIFSNLLRPFAHSIEEYFLIHQNK